MAFLVCQLEDIWNELQSEMEGTHGRDFFFFAWFEVGDPLTVYTFEERRHLPLIWILKQENIS